MSQTIQHNTVVAFTYTLHDGEGELIEDSEGELMVYLHGHENIVPGLERALLGKKVGDKVDVTVAPEDAYGERVGELQGANRADFPPGMEIEAGMQFGVDGPDGQFMPVWVDSVEGDTVWLDFNHPLAGVTLRFAVEVKSMREATADELVHGHPHGVDGTEGHHHGHDH